MTSATRTYTRSISQLKTFTRCGEMFYLERIRRKDMFRRPAPWTIMGVAVHDTIMEWEKSDRELEWVDFYLSTWDILEEEAWEEQPDEVYWFLPPMAKYVRPVLKKYRERGEEQLQTYIDEVRYAPWEISHLEEPFEIDLDGIVVKGAVDRILFFPADETYIVEDLKTGTVKDEADFRQLGFYAFVARELWNLPVTSGRYWFTKANRPSEEYFFEFMDRKFWTNQFKMLDKAIAEGIYLASPGGGCTLCPVQPWCSTQGHLEIGDRL